MSRCDLDLWPLTLKVRGRPTSSVWSKSVRFLSEIEQSPAELHVLIILRLSRTRYVTLWPWSLSSCFKLLYHFECHAFKLWTTFERNRIIHGWVIDDLSRVLHAFLAAGAQLTAFSGMRGPNFAKLGEDIHVGRSSHSQHCNVVSHSNRPILILFKLGRLKDEWY